MNRLMLAAFTVVSLGYYVGCAPVQFAKDPNCGTNCVSINGVDNYRYAVTPNAGKVDILIIDDNSRSMSTEQGLMAQRLSSFLQSLDSQGVDYRIGITTTDIIKDGGQLKSFADGSAYLVPSTANKASLFAQGIQRQETLSCDQNGTDCASDDERALYAANMIVQSNPSGFIRSEAHLAVVILSDEDERSQVYDKANYLPTYQLTAEDLPQTLIQEVQNDYNGKTLSIHAIIVRPGSLNGISATDAANRIANGTAARGLFAGGDSGCLMVQATQVYGSSASSSPMVTEARYGYLYALAARMTGGVEGNICASDYSSQLTSLGQNIGNQVLEVTLPCDNPAQIDSSTPLVTFTPAGGTYTLSGNKIQFSQNLAPGTQAYLQFSCPE